MGTKIRSGGRFFIAGKDGQPANGWKVYTYTAGSAGVYGTDDKATYTDYTLGTEQTNPIILDSRGEAEVWWNDTYLIKVYDENDVLIYSMDYFGQGEDSAFDTALSPLNGSFEVDDNGDGAPNNWTVIENAGGTVAIDSTDADHGLNSLKFTSTANTGAGTAETDKFAVQPGETRDLQLLYKASAADSLNSVDVRWYNHAGTLLSTSSLWSEAAANSTSWAEILQPVTVPANAVNATILITGMNGSGTTYIGNTKFDNVRFNRVGSSILGQKTVPSAVNRIEATDAASGNKPSLNQVGDDDVGMDFEGVELKNGVVTASSFVGNSASATKWATARSIILTGEVGGSASIDGTANASITATIAANVIGQNELKKATTTTIGVSGGSNNITVPAGEYGFYPRMWGTGAPGAVTAQLFNYSTIGTSAATYIYLSETGGTGSVYASHRYLTASPPYDLGDGEVAEFIFLLIENSTGRIIASYVAQDAPWHYNGPTNIIPDEYFEGVGYKFRPVVEFEPDFRQRLRDPLTRSETLARRKTDGRILVEVDQSIKNADMNLIPHPFTANDLTGNTVVLLDPVSPVIQELAELVEVGENINDDIHNGRLIIGNTMLQRSGPAGLLIPSVRWRNTRR